MESVPGVLVVFLFVVLFIVAILQRDRASKRSEELRVILNDLMAKIFEDPNLEFVTEAYYRSVREAGRYSPRPAPRPPSQGDRP